MNRTNHNEFLSVSGASGKNKISWAEFLASNRVLLVFSLLFLSGVLLGIVIFSLSSTVIHSDLGVILDGSQMADGFHGGVVSLFSSSFSAILLLALLFLFGLSACGAPFALAVPLFFGMGLGLTEAYYYSEGVVGLAQVGLLVAPHYLVASAALVLGSMESIRMSLLFSRQLLPGVTMGGLWESFKLYCARFLVFLILAVVSGVVDVLMRLLFGHLFV